MRISPNCYAVTGLAYEPPWSVNAGFITGNKRTLIIDTGGTTLSARTIHGYAQAARPGNELAVINTERHLDHVGGNFYFREQGAEIWGHVGIARREEDLAEAIADYNQTIQNPVRRAAEEGRVFYDQTHIANPTQKITEETSLDLGDLVVQIILTPGHTATNLSVYVPDEGVVYCGDCLVSGYIPNLEAGTLDDWLRWEQSLDRLEALEPKAIVPGHGEVLQGSRIAEEIARSRQILAAAIEESCPPTLLPRWQLEKARLLKLVKTLPEQHVKLPDHDSQLEIKLLEPGEFELMREIVAQAFSEYTGKLAVPASGENEPEEVTRQALTQGWAILAWLDGQPVGSARFQLKPDYLYIERVAVVPTHKGQGIGTAMLEYMEMVARNLERERLRLGTRQSMPQNITLYRRLGYEVVSVWPHPRGNDKIVLMLKNLNPAG